MARKRPKTEDPVLNPAIPNPYYTGTTNPAPALERGSIRSRHWTELNPAWLAQEAINRGPINGQYRVGDRVLFMERDGDGWLISCYLGEPRNAGVGMLDATSYTEYRVTDIEVAAGQMMEANVEAA